MTFATIRRSALGLYFGWAFAAASLAHASNYHEHLHTLPSYDNISQAFAAQQFQKPWTLDRVLGRTFLSMVRHNFGDEVLVNYLVRSGILNATTRQYVDLTPMFLESATKRLEKTTWSKFGETLTKSIRDTTGRDIPAREVQRTFFEYTSLSPKGPRTYQHLENARRTLLQEATKEPGLFFRVFDNYLKSTSIAERRMVSFSVPVSFAQEKFALLSNGQSGGLADLRDAFHRAGSEVEFFITQPRSFFHESGKEYDRILGELQPILRQRDAKGQLVVQGVDMVGSIYESTEKAAPAARLANMEANLKTSLTELPSGSQFRFHLFEGASGTAASESLFTALENAMKDPLLRKKLPSVIRIGHVNALNTQDIARFASLQKQLANEGSQSRFIFELNPFSNAQLQNVGTATYETYRRLGTTVEQLHASGFTVVLGADGQGIFGASSRFSESVRLLSNSGMKDTSVMRLFKDSALSAPTAPHSKYLHWVPKEVNRLSGEMKQSLKKTVPQCIRQALIFRFAQ